MPSTTRSKMDANGEATCSDLVSPAEPIKVLSLFSLNQLNNRWLITDSFTTVVEVGSGH